jgi:retinol-binding protein 3
MKYTLMCIMMCVASLNNALAQSAVGKSKPVSVKILIDSLDRALYRTYIFPDKSQVMGNYLKSQLKKGAYKNISDPKLLADKIGGDLQAAHKDGHLRIHYDPEFSARGSAQQKNSGPPDLTEAIKHAKQENFSFRKVEVLDGNIGYVVFQGFNGFIEEAKPTLTAAFRFVSNTNAVIIDLRNNGGGSPWMVKQICSYFYQERTRLNDIYERRANKTMEFWAEPEVAESMKLSMPLYILTSKHTFSAAEDFTYAMQVNKRAIIVGETTGGGAHPTGPVDIGQGFVIDIPFARSINHITQTDWEGTGVVPDIAVAADEALRKAHTLALEAQLATAVTAENKKQVQWSLRALMAHDYTTTHNAIYETYAGEYGKFSITLKDAKLYLHDFNGRTFLLKPIEGSQFLATDWLQAEFLTSASGSISLKLLGKPGWEDIYERTK